MDLMREWLAPYLVDCFLGLALIQIVTFVLLLVTWINYRGVRKQQKRLLKGMTRDSLEQLLSRFSDRLHSLERDVDEAAIQMDALKNIVQGVKGKVGLVRYNALSEQGSNLSFSIAIVDEELNGVVITSLYGRSQSYTYAKPLVNGTSEYALSDEEKKAISVARGAREEALATAVN